MAQCLVPSTGRSIILKFFSAHFSVSLRPTRNFSTCSFRATRGQDTLSRDRIRYPVYARKRSMSSFVGTSRANKANWDDRIVWVDLEMTGLEPETHTIVEMACIITDADLNTIAESPNVIINHPEQVLDNMSDWCKEHFAKSGLTDEIRSSRTSISEAESIMVNFIRSYTNAQKSPLAGNTVYMDRLFLRRHMPVFEAHLHYRLIDVSTIKELSRRWYPTLNARKPPKELAHRAMQDIQESIQELQWYRKNLFRDRDST